MSTGNAPGLAPNNAPRRPHLGGAKKAAGWLGRVAIAQVIGHFVRNWWS
jgi:hypothetical protein